MRREPLRFCLAAGALLLLFASGCLAAVILDSALRPCRSCDSNAAYVRILALDQMSWVPSGRPSRYPLAGADRRFDPHLPLPSPDPADIIFHLPLVLEAAHDARD